MAFDIFLQPQDPFTCCSLANKLCRKCKIFKFFFVSFFILLSYLITVPGHSLMGAFVRYFHSSLQDHCCLKEQEPLKEQWKTGCSSKKLLLFEDIMIVPSRHKLWLEGTIGRSLGLWIISRFFKGKSCFLKELLNFHGSKEQAIVPSRNNYFFKELPIVYLRNNLLLEGKTIVPSMNKYFFKELVFTLLLHLNTVAQRKSKESLTKTVFNPALYSTII